MTLLRLHMMMGVSRLPPGFVRSQSVSGGAVTSYTITPTVAPIPGNVMIVALGGFQTRTINPPAGWTLDRDLTGAAGGTSAVYSKIVTISEPASYVFNWTGNLQGGACYYEFKNIEIVQPRKIGDSQNFTVPFLTSLSHTTYNIPYPALVIANYSSYSGAEIWAINNGFTVALSGRFCSAYRIYNEPKQGEVTTWNGTTTQLNLTLAIYQGKIIT